uniref:Uncharacterized protein n=1 Tax=Spongospora subterranea TaxID=70186 RepID=A0A0H5RNJ0_9EUKA|eukprot:CRZ10289.1 hypothetical protein [Spongospora subterranea]
MRGVDKNLDKWSQVEDFGTRVSGTCLLPTKALSTVESHGHTVETFLSANPNVSSIIDLSSEVEDYKISDHFPNVRHLKLSFESKVIPSQQHVDKFINLVQDNLPLDQINGLIAVHCHYGFNRTGFLVCCYLCQVHHLTPSDAINRFKLARPPGIKHEHFLAELYRRYSGNVEESKEEDATT